VRRALGASLRRHRDAEGRTLSAVAAEAGCSPAHLSEVERGRKDVSTELLVAIAYALRVPIAGLYTEVSESLAPPSEGPLWPVDPRARLEMAAGQLSRDGLRAVAEFGTFMAMGGGELPRRRIAMYSRHTGRAEEQVARDLNRDLYLSASEALDYGLIDRIVEHRPDQRVGPATATATATTAIPSADAGG
jgi:transcriptional regulator with XRE-family HTH domain